PPDRRASPAGRGRPCHGGAPGDEPDDDRRGHGRVPGRPAARPLPRYQARERASRRRRPRVRRRSDAGPGPRRPQGHVMARHVVDPTSMHRYTDETERVARAALTYARDRLRLHPVPLDGPRTADELTELAGATIT